MNKEYMKTINLESFKAVTNLLDYYDNDVIAINAKNIPMFKENFRIDCFLIIYCFKDEIHININNKDYILNKDNHAVLLPGTIVGIPSILKWKNKSENDISLIGFSTSFLKNTIQFKKETWNIIYNLYQNPILPAAPQISYKFYLYKELAYTLITEQTHIYKDEILKHFFATLFTEMISEICKVLPSKYKESAQHSKRANWIFHKFIELVLEDDGTHRSVSYYADKLCYSPKHLSTIIKEVCGRPPLKIINEHAIEQIKYKLKYSDKSMKEIADEFNFSNPSFFGKFVKQHLGISPQQYRDNTEKN
jgi:AraC-like DNA-binding protein